MNWTVLMCSPTHKVDCLFRYSSAVTCQQSLIETLEFRIIDWVVLMYNKKLKVDEKVDLQGMVSIYEVDEED